MPKVSRIGKFRKAAATSLPKGSLDDTTTSSGASHAAPKQQEPSQQLSRGQRKRQTKREQYLRREKMILSTLQLKRKKEQSKRIDGMDALREALLSSSTSSPNAGTGTNTKGELEHGSSTLFSATNKAKKSLAAREVTHMNLVLQHPEFQSNPFATIQAHLKNTLAEQRQSLQQHSEARSRAEREQALQRKQQQKEKRQAAGGKHRKKYHATRRSRR